MMRDDLSADTKLLLHDNHNEMAYDSDEGFDCLDDSESQKLLSPPSRTSNGIIGNSNSNGQYHRSTGSTGPVLPAYCNTTPTNGAPLNPYTYRPMPSRRSNKRYTSWAILTVTLFLLVMVYIPLSNNFHVSTRIVPISGWDKNTTRETSFYVFPQLNTTIIDPAVHVCADKIFLLMVVCSSSVNFEIRQSIRETWANLTEFNYPFFAKVHSKFKGQYLNINYMNWKQYIVNDDNDKHHRTFVPTSADQLLPPPITAPEDQLFDASTSKFAVKVVFLVGQTLSNETQQRISAESETNGDLIQESFLDSYNNLTLKTIMMLKWVKGSCCDKVKFLMKCDDDTFVNVPNLLHILLGGTVPVYNATIQEYDQGTIRAQSPKNRLNKYHNLLLGSRFCNSKPISNVSSKWYTPMYMYSGNIYPNYLSGTGYVMSIDVAMKLYNASLTTPVFHLEDVYLTGICAEAVKVRPTNHQLFSYTSYRNLCELKGMITKHELTAGEMRKAYDFVRNTSANCAKPDKYFHVRKIKTRLRNCM